MYMYGFRRGCASVKRKIPKQAKNRRQLPRPPRPRGSWGRLTLPRGRQSDSVCPVRLLFPATRLPVHVHVHVSPCGGPPLSVTAVATAGSSYEFSYIVESEQEGNGRCGPVPPPLGLSRVPLGGPGKAGRVQEQSSDAIPRMVRGGCMQ